LILGRFWWMLVDSVWLNVHFCRGKIGHCKKKNLHFVKIKRILAKNPFRLREMPEKTNNNRFVLMDLVVVAGFWWSAVDFWWMFADFCGFWWMLMDLYRF